MDVFLSSNFSVAEGGCFFLMEDNSLSRMMVLIFHQYFINLLAIGFHWPPRLHQQLHTPFVLNYPAF
jgi:hypothetical protein